MTLTLALISDLHFGPEARFAGKLRKLTASAEPLARAFVERMNARDRPDLVVNLGDDIEDEGLEADRARYQRCVSVLREARAEIVHVAGNHDVVNLSPADLRAAWGPLEALTGAPVPEERLYYAFERGGLRFIVLHTRERKDHDVSVGPEQLAWLEGQLSAHAGPSIVLMHHSAADQDLRGNRWFEGSPHICLVRERRAIRALFARHGGVRAVFNGHLHWNHLDVIDGIPYVTLQSLVENLDEDAPGRAAAAHALVRIDERRIAVEIEGGGAGALSIRRAKVIAAKIRRLAAIP